MLKRVYREVKLYTELLAQILMIYSEKIYDKIYFVGLYSLDILNLLAQNINKRERSYIY